MSDSPQYQTITVKGHGDIDFPANMSMDQIHDALVKNFPNPAAKQKSVQELSDMLHPDASWSTQPRPIATPESLFTRPGDDSSAASKEQYKQVTSFRQRMSAGSREASQYEAPFIPAHQGTVPKATAADWASGKIPGAVPAQDLQLANPIDLGQNATLRGSKLANVLPEAQGARLAQEQMVQNNPRTRTVAHNASGDSYISDMNRRSEINEMAGADQLGVRGMANVPLLGPGLDVAAPVGRELTNLSRALWLGPEAAALMSQLDTNNPAMQEWYQHPGTKSIPEFVAPHPSDAPWQAVSRGFAEGTWNTAEGLTTPSNLALAAGMTIAPELGIGKVAGAGFAGQMTYHGIPAAWQGGKELLHGELHEGTRDLTQAAMELYMAKQGAKHALASPETAAATPALDKLAREAQLPPGERPARENSLFTQDEWDNWQSRTIPGAKGQQKLLTAGTPGSEAERTATPQLPQSQAENPSTPTPSPKKRGNIAQANDMEKGFRPVVETIAKLIKLKQAGEDRMHVQRAVDAAGKSPFSDEDLEEFRKQGWTPPASTGPDYPFLDTKAPYEKLDASEKQTVDTVAKHLQVDPRSLYTEDGEWRLSGEQHEHLKGLLEEGKTPPKNTDNIHPLARIDDKTAGAAGLPGAKKMREYMDPSDVAELEAEEYATAAAKGLDTRSLDQRKQYSNWRDDPTVVRLASTPKSHAYSGEAARIADLHAGGGQELGLSDANLLGINLDNPSLKEARLQGVQGVLQKAIDKGIDYLKERIPAWEAKRSGTSKASKLAQDVAAMDPEVRANLPKELYDQKHLGTQADTTTPSANVQEPVQRTAAAQSPATPEGTDVSKEPEGQGGKLSVKRAADFGFTGTYEVSGLDGGTKKIYRSPETGYWYEDKSGHYTQNLLGFTKTEALEALQKKYGFEPAQVSESGKLVKGIQGIESSLMASFPEETKGAFPLIKQTLKDRLGETSESLPKMYVAALKLFAKKLQSGEANALSNTVHTLKLLKSGDTTLYANPISELYRRAVRSANPSSGAESMAEFYSPDPGHPVDTFTQDLANQPSTKEPLQTKFNRWIKNEGQRVPAFLAAAKNSLAVAVQNFFPALKDAWEKFADKDQLSSTHTAFGTRNLDYYRLAGKYEPFINEFERVHPDPIRRAAIVAHAESFIGQVEGPVQESDTQGRGLLFHRDDADAAANLREQATNVALMAKSSRAFAKAAPVYEAALNLTDAERTFAERYKQFNNELVDWEHSKGLTYQALSDYWMHAFKPGATLRDAIKGLQGSSGFQTKASFMKMRSAMTYYDGLMRGLEPTSMDGAYLMAQRGLTSTRVVANRDMVARLMQMHSKDGTPVLAFNRAFTHVDPTEGDKGAVSIKTGLPPEAKTADGRPYVPYEHPSFTDWRWWGQDSAGRSILGMSDVWVHPDEIDYIRREMDPSLFRQYAPLNAAVNVRNTGKSTVLSLSGFHGVQLTTHAIDHDMVGALSGTLTADSLKVLNPFHGDKVVNLDDLDQQQLVVHGLEMKSPLDPSASVSEGLTGKGGLTEHIPVLGAINRAIHNLTFNKVQPDLKMQTALDMLKRNRNTYLDKWTAEELENVKEKLPDLALEEQARIASQLAQSRIYRRTAAQANYSFGGINFAKLGIGKTGQDALGFLLLAPDFLAARVGFTVDAFRPGGAESRWALGLGMATTFAVTQGLNYALNKKTDFDPKNPDTWGDWNRVRLGDYSVSLRSVMGDDVDIALGIRNSIKYGDRNQAIEHRLNPMLRPIIELSSNSDAFGNRSTRGQQVLDAFNSGMPIPVQGAVQALASVFNKGLRQPRDNHEMVGSLLSAFGLQFKKYRSPAETIAFREFDKLPKAMPGTDLELEQKNTFKYLREQIRQDKLDPTDIENAINGRGRYVPGIGVLRLKQSEVPYLFKTSNDSPLVTESRQLTPQPFFRVWQAASPEQRLELAPIFMKKINATPECPEKEEMRKAFNQYLEGMDSESINHLESASSKETENASELEDPGSVVKSAITQPLPPEKPVAYTDDQIHQAAQKTFSYLPPEIMQNVGDVSKIRFGLGSYNDTDPGIAQTRPGQDLIKVAKPKVFLSDPAQFVAHELIHRARYRLPQEIQNRFAPTSENTPYGGIDKPGDGEEVILNRLADKKYSVFNFSSEELGMVAQRYTSNQMRIAEATEKLKHLAPNSPEALQQIGNIQRRQRYMAGESKVLKDFSALFPRQVAANRGIQAANQPIQNVGVR